MEDSPIRRARPRVRVSRRTVLGGALAAGAAAIIGGVAYRDIRALFSSSSDSPGTLQPGDTLADPRLDEIASRVVPGGPPKDGIPPVDRPKYISREEADSVWKDDDVVDGMTLGGEAKAFPRGITVWHEIVNEVAEGKAISVTYCPLTGSSIGFYGGDSGKGREATMGTSGKLYNSNLVMYDRRTDSYWPQLLGRAVSGERTGEILEEFEVVTTTWGRWKALHPDTLVLSTDTGHVRAYGVSPYGDYDNDSSIFFPVTARDDRFHVKKVFIAGRLGDEQIAVGREVFADKRLVEETLGGEPIVIVYDDELDFVRFFSRESEAGELNFRLARGAVTDVQTGSSWDVLGRATEGQLKGTRLRQINSFAVQWFAWAAFWPQTKVIV